MMLQKNLQSESSIENKPTLRIFTNSDDKSIADHHLARCIYAETLGESLGAVEQLCVMVRNTGRDIFEITKDETIFESLNKKSPRNEHLLVDYNNPKFQMCLRTVRNMENIPDKIYGSTRFHRDDFMPDWATSLGTVAEIDGLLFYL